MYTARKPRSRRSSSTKTKKQARARSQAPATGVQPGPTRSPLASSPTRRRGQQERDPAEAGRSTACWASSSTPVREAEVGAIVMDVDQQDHQDRGDRIVEPALTLEDRRQPGRVTGGGAHGTEDRGGVGRRDGPAPTRRPWAQRQVEQQGFAATPQTRAGDHHPDAGQQSTAGLTTRRMARTSAVSPPSNRDDRQADERHLLGSGGRRRSATPPGPSSPMRIPHSQEQQERQGRRAGRRKRACRDPGNQGRRRRPGGRSMEPKGQGQVSRDAEPGGGAARQRCGQAPRTVEGGTWVAAPQERGPHTERGPASAATAPPEPLLDRPAQMRRRRSSESAPSTCRERRGCAPRTARGRRAGEEERRGPAARRASSCEQAAERGLAQLRPGLGRLTPVAPGGPVRRPVTRAMRPIGDAEYQARVPAGKAGGNGSRITSAGRPSR